MSFILIYPPGDEEVLETDKTSSPFAPLLGLLYIARILENQGHEVNIIDGRAESISTKFLELMDKSVDGVGVSISTFSIKNSLKIINAIKSMHTYKFVFCRWSSSYIIPKRDIKNV